MTYPVYTEAQLNSFSRSELWPICQQLGCPKYASNQECREAILEKQPKAIARAAAKKQVVTTQEIDFYTHEILVDGAVAATINYDSSNFVTQPWVISINSVECFRDTTYNRVHTWFRIHHTAGTLPCPAAPSADIQLPNITEHEQKLEVLALLGLEIEEPALQPETTSLFCPVCHGEGSVSTGDDIVEDCQYCDGQGNLYTLQYAFGAAPRTYRVYDSNDSMIGVIFQHITHWSNSIDNIQHFEAIDAAVCLDKFMSRKLIKTPVVAVVTAAVLCLLPMLSPAIALDDPLGRGGCRDGRGYVPPNNGGPDSQPPHGTGTR